MLMVIEYNKGRHLLSYFEKKYIYKTAVRSTIKTYLLKAMAQS